MSIEGRWDQIPHSRGVQLYGGTQDSLILIKYGKDF